jgi:hypothetical protein
MAESISEIAERGANEIASAVPGQKPISTRTHGILDYTLSPTLLLAPQAFGFPGSGAASVVPRAYGAASMIYSALTEYELGLYPVVPMKTHLILDTVSSVFLAASPWLLGFGKRSKKRSWLPHLLFAVSEAAIVALSDARSTRRRT